MNDVIIPIIVALIAVIPPTIISFLNMKKINDVHISINSRMTELLAAAKGVSKAEGVEQGRNETK